jgi:riboflavin kinase/FMN adenylyltransferase
MPNPQYYRSLEAVHLTNAWLTIGVFDGVHRGHQEILRQLTTGAHANGAPAVVLTFSPHPAMVLAGRDIKCLTTLDERVEILLSLGIDTVISMEFTRELAGHSAEDFMAVVKRQLNLEKLLIGYDFALGKDRAGNFERLAQIGQEMDFEVQTIRAVQVGENVISSTGIRRAVAEGAMTLAEAGLGRSYAISGTVIPGDGRGRTIGIPTANVDVAPEKAIPANGVYACQALVDGESHKAVTNIGVRPTFTGSQAQVRIEAHLFDYSNDLYGKNITLEFVERLRGEQKFAGVDALVAQIQADIARARQIL